MQSERQKAAAYADQQIPIIVRILKDKSLFEKLRERRGAIINSKKAFRVECFGLLIHMFPLFK